MLLRVRQQNASEDIEAYADNLLELAENAYPDGDYRFKEELAKDHFSESVRCSDGFREQLFMKQADSLAAAVRLVRQLQSARTASRNSTLSTPARPQLNFVEGGEDFSDVAELRSLMVSTQDLKGWNNNDLNAADVPHGHSPSFNVIVVKIMAITPEIALMLREKDRGDCHGSISPLESSKDPKCFYWESVEERQFVCSQWTWCLRFWSDQSRSDFNSTRYWHHLQCTQ